MRDIHWLREAEDEFADIIIYVMQQFGQGVAMRVYDDIISRIDLLVEFPDLGTSEPRYHFNGLPLRVLTQSSQEFFIVFKRLKSSSFYCGTTEWTTEDWQR